MDVGCKSVPVLSNTRKCNVHFKGNARNSKECTFNTCVAEEAVTETCQGEKS